MKKKAAIIVYVIGVLIVLGLLGLLVYSSVKRHQLGKHGKLYPQRYGNAGAGSIGLYPCG